MSTLTPQQRKEVLELTQDAFDIFWQNMNYQHEVVNALNNVMDHLDNEIANLENPHE